MIGLSEYGDVVFLLQVGAHGLLDAMDELVVGPLLLELLVVDLPPERSSAVDRPVVVPHQHLWWVGGWVVEAKQPSGAVRVAGWVVYLGHGGVLHEHVVGLGRHLQEASVHLLLGRRRRALFISNEAEHSAQAMGVEGQSGEKEHLGHACELLVCEEVVLLGPVVHGLALNVW